MPRNNIPTSTTRMRALAYQRTKKAYCRRCSMSIIRRQPVTADCDGCRNVKDLYERTLAWMESRGLLNEVTA